MEYDIQKQINELSNDRTHGAGWLSLLAIDIMVHSITRSKQTDITGILNEAGSIISTITGSRHNMVSIYNYLSIFHKIIVNTAGECSDISSFAKAVEEHGRTFKDKMEVNSGLAAENGASLIHEGDVIITCSYSSLFCRAMASARKRNINYEVVICESRIKDISYGAITRQNLDKYNISSRMVKDHEIKHYVYIGSKVITGADSVLKDGSLINGTPSKMLAEAANKVRIPCYAICENAKFDTGGNINKTESEAGFDLLPGAFITALITESGIITPQKMAAHIQYLKTFFQ